MPIKFCTKCQILKDHTEFNKDKSRNDGLTTWCKACVKRNSSNHYSRNKDNISQNRKAQRAENLEAKRAYYREYYQNNKDIWKECGRKWNARNRHLCNALWHKYDAKKINAMPSWANEEAIKVVFEECHRLNKETGVQHHVDHIVPLRNPVVCGLHVHYNLRIVTAEVNIKKGNKLLPELVVANDH